MVGLTASGEAASGQLDGKLTAPSLVKQIANNQETVALQAGALLHNVGTFVGVRSDGTFSIQESRNMEDLVLQSQRLRDAFDKAFSEFKQAIGIDGDSSYSAELEMIRATQDYFDFLRGK